MLPGQHLWQQEALLQSFLPHSLVSGWADHKGTKLSTSLVKTSFYDRHCLALNILQSQKIQLHL